MIKSDKHGAELNGTGFDLVMELNSIFAELYHASPSMLIGAVTAWTDFFSEHLDECNKIETIAYHKVTEKYIEKEFKRKTDHE